MYLYQFPNKYITNKNGYFLITINNAKIKITF